jgi:hypothetical protein
MALVVLGHEDAPVVGMAVEDHAEHVVDLALLVVGGRPRRGHGRHVGRVDRDAGANRDAVDVRHVEQLVVDAEPRLLGEVVDAVQGGEEAVALLAQLLERGRDGLGRDEHRRLVAEEDRVEHALLVASAQLLRDQLEAGRVRHSCPSCRRRRR